jgi:hypothetical protein
VGINSAQLNAGAEQCPEPLGVKTEVRWRLWVGPDSIKALRALIEQGGLDLDPDRDLRENPVTLDEMLNTIDARIRRRLENTDHPIYRSLAEQIERLRPSDPEG